MANLAFALLLAAPGVISGSMLRSIGLGAELFWVEANAQPFSLLRLPLIAVAIDVITPRTVGSKTRSGLSRGPRSGPQSQASYVASAIEKAKQANVLGDSVLNDGI